MGENIDPVGRVSRCGRCPVYNKYAFFKDSSETVGVCGKFGGHVRSSWSPCWTMSYLLRVLGINEDGD